MSLRKRAEAAETLKAQEGQQQNIVQEAEEAVKDLKRIHSTIRSQNIKCLEAKESMERMSKDAGDFRAEAKSVSRDLHNAIMGLSSIEESIRGMATELQDAGYAQSRREMAKRLRQLLTKMDSLNGTQNILLDQNVVKEAFDKLGEIDKHTTSLEEFTKTSV